MAVDTPSKRFSLLEMDFPFSMNLPVPSGSFDQGDRQQLLHGYSGILWESPAVGLIIDLITLPGLITRNTNIDGSIQRNLSVSGEITRFLTANGLITRNLDIDGEIQRNVGIDGDLE